MTELSLSPSNARKNFYQLLKDVNANHSQVEIVSDRTGNNAVLISLSDWQSIQETLFLEQVGVMDKVRERENDNTGFSAVSELDWDSL
ncbi:type II toxin-antitoxin system Phd/YefM family antitoxin [Lactococcus raffinolactis]|uniref:type II toxin-antitoxin system Phd/YefM family antitoxin n=1 Tax=Pseudolactococcus raffinolactis TaxID=1366 RepID=UPI00241717E1|nr:type II toxin-antitoxin system Phd/YefM family antitoxin [Lactococcus raffinolactis]MDG4962564.1 type II toxin-antitoxin system Phd/YefM family antitoxin [Lactococcus raffinolactis]